jgi:hypothetical protein
MEKGGVAKGNGKGEWQRGMAKGNGKGEWGGKG